MRCYGHRVLIREQRREVPHSGHSAALREAGCREMFIDLQENHRSARRLAAVGGQFPALRANGNHLCGAAASMREILVWMNRTRKMKAATRAH